MIILSDSKEKEDIIKIHYIHQKRFKKLAIFSHFDKKCIIDKYVVYAIKELYKLKFDIVFVTTSANINTNEFKKIDTYLLLYIIKENRGYDFISWKTGLSFVKDYVKYKNILHINDSIFFPLVNPKTMIKKMNNKKVDFWGITDSYKQTYHIESFFWVANKKLLRSDVYKNFWNECTILDNKSQVIEKYEIGFANLFIKYGYSCSTYISMREILKRLNISLLESSFENFEFKRSFNLFWDSIIKNFNAPFIKKNILIPSHASYNPTTVVYKRIIQKYTSYDVNLIENFLKRNNNNKLFIKENANKFFIDLTIFIKSIEELKSNKNLVIYGFGEIGHLVYSSLENNVLKIVDKNYISLSNRYKNINKFCSIEEINTDEDILITAFGREENIINNLNELYIDSKKVISIGKLLINDSLTFANNITKIFYTLDSLYKLSIERNYQLFVYTSNDKLVKMLKNYLKLNGMVNINFKIIKKTNKISFALFNCKKLILETDFVFV